MPKKNISKFTVRAEGGRYYVAKNEGGKIVNVSNPYVDRTAATAELLKIRKQQEG